MCVSPPVWYSETCIVLYSVKGALRKTIDAFATTAYRLMLDGIEWRDRVCNLDVLKMVGKNPLMMTVNSVVKRQLQKLGHNLRKNCTSIPHTYALYMLLHGRRKRGRPRLQYLKYIENVTGLKGVRTIIVDTAQNRKNGRMLKVDCGSCTQPSWVRFKFIRDPFHNWDD